MCSGGYWARPHRTPPCTGLDTVNSNRHPVGSGCRPAEFSRLLQEEAAAIAVTLRAAGSEFFITEAKRFAALWVMNASLGTPNVRQGDSLCREALCGQWFTADRTRSASRKKTFLPWSTPTTQLSRSRWPQSVDP